MVKYELKKLFSNKFIIVSIVACVAVIAAYAAYMSAVYNNGTYFALEKVIMQNGVLNGITVTKENIEELEQRLAAIEEDDANYENIDTSNRYLKYYGKYEEQTEKRIEEIYSLAQGRELTNGEQTEIDRLESYQISEDVFPEYYSLYYVINSYRLLEYQTTLDYFRRQGVFVNSLDQLPPKEKKELQRDLTRLENGVALDRNFGWQALLKSGNVSAVPVLMAVMIALSSVVAVTAEYETGMYSLIVCSRRGGKCILSKKIISSALFSVIVTLIYETAALVSFGAFFSLSGADSDSGVVLFGGVASMLECFLLMILFTLASSLAISFTSLAVSSFCGKTFAAAGANLVILLFAVIFGHFYIIANDNISGIMSSLPIHIPLVDFGISQYREITANGAILGAYDILLPLLPVCALLIAVSLPLLRLGWKNRRIEK